MSKTFFTSDLHFGHYNINLYCNRPFDTLEQMDSILIRNWNSRVKPEDTIFIIGDFCFRNSSGGKPGEGGHNKPEYYINQLNGNKVFVKGNHDGNNSLKTKIINATIEIDNKHINLVHDPLKCSYNHNINFVGHVHKSWTFRRMYHSAVIGLYTDCINVGVDVWKFMPVTYEEIKSKYSQWLKSMNT